jgi:beta-1,4-N-acetylglucosaminyltransferase
MIFLTVGTYPLPFDRLAKAIDAAIRERLIEEEIFAQIGRCGYKPQNMEYVQMLEKEAFDSYFQKASSIISHAGIGTITMALDNEKPLLVMPRLRKYGEVVNDHQLAIAQTFEELGHILAVYGAEDLPKRLRQLKAFVPKARKNQAKKVASRIAQFLAEANLERYGR